MEEPSICSKISRINWPAGDIWTAGQFLKPNHGNCRRKRAKGRVKRPCALLNFGDLARAGMVYFYCSSAYIGSQGGSATGLVFSKASTDGGKYFLLMTTS